MSLHNTAVSDTSKLVRVVRDDDGELVRVLLYEDWYDRLKPLYDRLSVAAGVVGVSEVPQRFKECVAYLSQLVLEFEQRGLGITVSLVALFSYLVQKGINLGKFTYHGAAMGTGAMGTGTIGGPPRLVELPTMD